MSCACRGRKDRLAFAASFTPAYHFRLLYMSSQMAYPIMGALRHCFNAPWEVRPPQGPPRLAANQQATRMLRLWQVLQTDTDHSCLQEQQLH